MRIRIMASVFVFALFSSPSISQFQIGAGGGMNFAKVHPIPPLEPAAKWSALNGAVAGAIGQYRISEIICALVEVNYIQKGYKFHSSVADGTDEVNYLEIPIGLKITPIESSVKPYVYAGIGAAFFINARQKADDIFGNSFNLDTKDNYRSNDYTGQLGVGLEYLANQEITAFIDSRYSTGLRTNSTTPGSKIKTDGIQIRIGFLYSINL